MICKRESGCLFFDDNAEGIAGFFTVLCCIFRGDIIYCFFEDFNFLRAQFIDFAAVVVDKGLLDLIHGGNNLGVGIPAGLFGALTDAGLGVGVQAFEPRGVGRPGKGFIGVVGDGDVVLDFLDVGGVDGAQGVVMAVDGCLLYTSPSPRDRG